MVRFTPAALTQSHRCKYVIFVNVKFSCTCNCLLIGIIYIVCVHYSPCRLIRDEGISRKCVDITKTQNFSCKYMLRSFVHKCFMDLCSARVSIMLKGVEC